MSLFGWKVTDLYILAGRVPTVTALTELLQTAVA